MKRCNICVIPAYPLENVQLMKDRVVIPYVCFRHFGSSMVILTQKNGEYPYLNYFEDITLHFLPCSEKLSHMQAAVQYVAENYMDIDLLFLFGPRLEYIELAHAYKTLNPKGIIYLKLDANSGWINALPLDDKKYVDFLKTVDIISCEARKLQSFIYSKWRRRIEYVPNGVYNSFYPVMNECRYNEKENMILTVGRIGSSQKNSHILLYAYAMSYPYFKEAWKLVMVGAVTPEFRQFFDEFCMEFPEIARHICLTGQINDREQLCTYYKKAKIFALTSYMEGGCPNVFAEAAGFGCTVITTNIDAAPDVTDGGRVGRVVNAFSDIPAYARALKRDYVPNGLAELISRALKSSFGSSVVYSITIDDDISLFACENNSESGMMPSAGILLNMFEELKKLTVVIEKNTECLLEVYPTAVELLWQIEKKLIILYDVLENPELPILSNLFREALTDCYIGAVSQFDVRTYFDRMWKEARAFYEKMETEFGQARI